MKPTTPHRRLGAATGFLVAWAGVAMVNAVMANLAASNRHPALGVRVLRVAYDSGHALALGVLSYVVIRAWSRAKLAALGAVRPWRSFALDLLGLAAVSYALAFPVLSEDLADWAATFAEGGKLSPGLARSLVVLAIATGAPITALIARLFARPWFRWVAVAGSIVVAVVNHFILTTDYPGAHLYVAWAAAIIAGTALSTLPAREAETSPARLWTARVALGLAAAWALWTLLVRPKERVLMAMLEERGSTLTPFLSLWWTPSHDEVPMAPIPEGMKPWLADRSEEPPVPSSTPDAPLDQIVILYTIDSLRADVIESGEFDEQLPQFARLKREGVHFTNARSPGTGTSFTLSAVFMGKYYSEQYWTIKAGATYPWEDTSPRFTEMLVDHGVHTASYISRKFMLNDFGIARGFDEDHFITPLVQGERSPTGKQLGQASIELLSKNGHRPLFLWIHNMDAHAPFSMAGMEGTPHERYVREIQLADNEIGLLRKAIKRYRLEDRTTLIVSSDHGEGFLEHGTRGHSTSVYEELLRIPLLVVGPHVSPRAEETPVSLIDLGPTILDLWGLPTPGYFMGQSLAPLIRGEPTELTRPICAETRLKQMMLLPDGLKLIRDEHLGTREIYDIVNDPLEQLNLIDEPGADREAQMSILATFFDVHRLRRPGYVPPYRKW